MSKGGLTFHAMNYTLMNKSFAGIGIIAESQVTRNLEES